MSFSTKTLFCAELQAGLFWSGTAYVKSAQNQKMGGVPTARLFGKGPRSIKLLCTQHKMEKHPVLGKNVNFAL